MRSQEQQEFDLEFIRKQFPAFSQPGQAFFENAGGSYMCRQVLDRYTHYATETRVQPYGDYPASQSAGAQMDASYRRLAHYLNVEENEIHIGPSTSQNTYVLSHALGEGLKAGDTLIVSEQEHEANSGVWHRLAKRGIGIKTWHVDPVSGLLAVDELSNLLDESVRLVAMTHCSNIVGMIHDIPAIAKRVHEVGALLLVDGVSYVPHGWPDVRALDADIYLFSTYKCFGTHQGVMVIRDRVNDLETQAHFFLHADAKKRMIPAGPDHAQVASLQGICDYFDAIDAHHGGEDDGQRPGRVAAMFKQREQKLMKKLLAYLSEHPQVRLIGSSEVEHRAPTISFSVNGRSSQEINRGLVKHGIMAGAGHFYAMRLLKRLGIDPDDGVVRLSFVHYTSEEEIESLLRALQHELR